MTDQFKESNIKIKIDVDDSSEDIRNKIKSAGKLRYNYVITIGEKEKNNINNAKEIGDAEIGVRIDKDTKMYRITDLIDEMISHIDID